MKKNELETKTGIGVDPDFYKNLPSAIDLAAKFPEDIDNTGKPALRIGFIGANSTGKTTLSNKIAPILGIPVLHETASVVVGDLKMLGHSKATCETQLAIYFGQLWAELSFNRFVSDRTLLDTVAHTEPAYDALIAQGDEGARYVCNSLSHAMSVHIKQTYDAIFYLPIEFEPVDDGFRDCDFEFQTLLDSKISSLIERFEIDVIELRGSIDDRLQTALDYVNQNCIKA